MLDPQLYLPLGNLMILCQRPRGFKNELRYQLIHEFLWQRPSADLDAIRIETGLLQLVQPLCVLANPDYAPVAAFLGCPALTLLHAHAVDRSGLDRCASTRCATRVGLICRDRRRVGAQRPAA